MKRNFHFSVAVVAALGFFLCSCSDTRTGSSLCTTCPEENPAEIAALEYVDDHRAELQLRDHSIDHLVIVRSIGDHLGMSHVVMDQYYRGVRVDGGVFVVHFNSDLSVSSVNGRIVPGIDVDVNPEIPLSVAQSNALDEAEDRALVEMVLGDGDSELTVFRLNEFDHLVWNVIIRSNVITFARNYLVDAHTGEVLYSYDLIWY